MSQNVWPLPPPCHTLSTPSSSPLNVWRNLWMLPYLRIYCVSSSGQPTRSGPPAWGFGVRLTTWHCKNRLCSGTWHRASTDLGSISHGVRFILLTHYTWAYHWYVTVFHKGVRGQDQEVGRRDVAWGSSLSERRKDTPIASRFQPYLQYISSDSGHMAREGTSTANPSQWLNGEQAWCRYSSSAQTASLWC